MYKKGNKEPLTELEYYQQNCEDWENIQQYIDLDPADYEVSYQIPPFKPNYNNAVVIHGLPIVESSKLEKLVDRLVDIFSKISNITPIKKTDAYVPFDEANNTSYGIGFIKLKNETDAAILIQAGEIEFGGRHKFHCTSYPLLEFYHNYSTEIQPIRLPQFHPRPDPASWLTDEKCRDQFVIRHGTETEVFWGNLTGEEPSNVFAADHEPSGKPWCDSYVEWSPQGSFLVSYHLQEFRLWGGDNFQNEGNFEHPNVKLVDFSPCENFIISYYYPPDLSKKDPGAIKVFDVRNRTEIFLNPSLKDVELKPRVFELEDPLSKDYQVIVRTKEQVDKDKDKDGQKKFVDKIIRGKILEVDNQGRISVDEAGTKQGPFTRNTDKNEFIPLQDPNKLKWSPDGKYFARLLTDKISVYKMPAITEKYISLLDNKSIGAVNVQDFCWSPKSNLISYWSPAVGNLPAMINIISIPDRSEICSRKLFDVTDGKLLWQNEGDYLCVYFTKSLKNKKTWILMFFRVSQPGVPVEQLELSEPVRNVKWEPSGDRIIIVHGDSSNISKYSISFYSMSGSKDKGPKRTEEITLLYTLPGVQCNKVLWSPAGSIVALAYFPSSGDSVMFDLHDVDNNLKLASRRHDRSTELAWDPSGRVIASCTLTQLRKISRGNVDDGYNLYSFKGNLIAQVRKEKLFQFHWRPRPRDLLSSEEKKAIIKNLKKYEKIFEKEDRQRRAELREEFLSTRRAIVEDFFTIVRRNKAIYNQRKNLRVQARKGFDFDDERNFTTISISDEEIISTKEVPV